MWSDACEDSFQELKERQMTAPILSLPSESGGFVVFTDASRTSFDYVLMQNGKVIAYGFCQLKEHERNYVMQD